MTDDIVKLPVEAALSPGLQIDPHVLHDMLRRRRTRRRRWIAEVADPAAAKRKVAALGARLRGRRWQAELRLDRGEDARAQVAEIVREAGSELVALREPRPVAPPQEGRPRPSAVLPRGAWLPERVAGYDGAGIAIGVVDFGFRYDHVTFRRPDGSSRIAWLWDQNPSGRGPDPLDVVPDHPFSAGYGVAHSRAEIDGWLAAAVGPYNPEADYYDPALLTLGLHGTHVASLAAGSPFKVLDSLGAERTFAGVAPGADLYLVQLGVSRSDFAEPAVPASLVGTIAPPAPRALSDNTRLRDAVHWIIARAIADGRRGVVINLSLATHAGAHDGRSMVENEIDRLIEAVERGGASMPMIAVVICAGNAGDARAHAAVPLNPGGTGGFGWEIQPLDEDLSEIELWHDPTASIEVTLHAPPHLDRLGFGPWPLVPTDDVAGRWLRGPEPERAAFGWWSNTRHHGNARPACLGVRIDPGLDDHWDRARRLNGVWTFALRHAGGPPAVLHAWVEREYGPAPARVTAPPSALRAAYARSTLGSLCCGRHSIVVGAAFQAPSSPLGFRASANSGTGPRPWQPPPLDWSETDDPARPHLCAVGIAAVGAGGRDRSDAALMDGTSQAAPQVAGALALMMQAVPAGRRLSAHALRAALIAAARARPLYDPADRSDLVGAERAGAGLLDAERAVALAADADAP